MAEDIRLTEARRGLPLGRHVQAWRAIRNWTLALLALAALGVGVWFLINDTRADQRHEERHQIDQCLANHGIVHINQGGSFDGCYYGNLPGIGGTG